MLAPRGSMPPDVDPAQGIGRRAERPDPEPDGPVGLEGASDRGPHRGQGDDHRTDHGQAGRSLNTGLRQVVRSSTRR